MTLIKIYIKNKLKQSCIYTYTSWYLYLNACLTKGKHKQNCSTNLPLSLWLHKHSSWLSTCLQITLSCHHSAHNLYWCSICGKQICPLYCILSMAYAYVDISTAVLSVANTCHLYCCSIYGKYVSSLLLFYLWQIHVISTAVLSVANKHCETCCIYVRQSCSQFSSLISFFHSLLGFCCCFFLLLFSLFPHSKASFQKVMHPAHQTISIFAFYICAIKFQVVHKPV